MRNVSIEFRSTDPAKLHPFRISLSRLQFDLVSPLAPLYVVGYTDREYSGRHGKELIDFPSSFVDTSAVCTPIYGPLLCMYMPGVGVCVCV